MRTTHSTRYSSVCAITTSENGRRRRRASSRHAKLRSDRLRSMTRFTRSRIAASASATARRTAVPIVGASSWPNSSGSRRARSRSAFVTGLPSAVAIPSPRVCDACAIASGSRSPTISGESGRSRCSSRACSGSTNSLRSDCSSSRCRGSTARSRLERALVGRGPRTGFMLAPFLERHGIEPDLAHERRTKLMADALQLVQERLRLIEELLACLVLDTRDRGVHPIVDLREALLELIGRLALLAAEAPDRVVHLAVLLTDARGQRPDLLAHVRLEHVVAMARILLQLARPVRELAVDPGEPALELGE